MSRSFEGAHGNRLVATEMGPADGWPVLLLHGGGQTRHAWSRTARHLAEAGFHAVALDQRGHGDSAWVADGAYAFADFAADATAVAERIAAERRRKPVAIGASVGGMAALLACEDGAEPFAAVILVDIVPMMTLSGVDRVQGFMRARAREGFASVEEAAAAVAAYLPHRPRPTNFEGLKKNLRHQPDGRWRWHWDPLFVDGPRDVNTAFENMQQRASVAAQNIAVPTLLVRGAFSELVTPAAARAFVADLPEAEWVDVAGARHMVAGDRNDIFSEAALRFLNERFPA